MILMIDNYDSFVYNLMHYMQELGADVKVVRNNAISLAEIRQMAPDHIVISPGPCSPDQAGISLDVITHFAGVIPILGVCLGHQAIGQAFDGKVIRAFEPVHGKVHKIHHSGTGLFLQAPNPLPVTRYHSLIIDKKTFPQCLEVTAETESGEIMALRHREFPIAGVQFHPEAVLTEFGHGLLRNFLQGNL